MQTVVRTHCRSREKEDGDGAASHTAEALPETVALLAGKLQSCAWLSFGQLSSALPLPQPCSGHDQATMDEKG